MVENGLLTVCSLGFLQQHVVGDADEEIRTVAITLYYFIALLYVHMLSFRWPKHSYFKHFVNGTIQILILHLWLEFDVLV